MLTVEYAAIKWTVLGLALYLKSEITKFLVIYQKEIPLLTQTIRINFHMLCLRMYPAKSGDAFLIRDDVIGPTAILIDGGYASTFHGYISLDLKHLATSDYALDLVVATHIDADHISGLLSFFKLNGNSHAPEIIRVKNVLHNSLRSLAFPTVDTCETVSDGDKELIFEIRRRGYPPAF